MTAVRPLDGVGVVGTGCLAGALVALTAEFAGPAAFVALVVAPAVVVLVLRPGLTLALLVAGVVVLESDDETFLAGLGNVTAFYGGTPVAGLGVVDLLTAILVAGIAVRAVRERRFAVPDPFTLPLLLLAAAVAFGLAQGVFSSGVGVDMSNTIRRLLPLLILPFAVVNVLRTPRDADRALAFMGALVAYKAITGAIAVATGTGREVEGTVLAYYSSLPNLLLMGFLLFVLARVVSGGGLPRHAWWLAPLALAVLALSFRRNFWIATVLGAVIVLLVGSGRRGRALLVPGAVVVVCAVVAAFSFVSSSQSQSPLVQRAQSLAPSRVEASSDDRYRLDEQRNVLAELRRHPLTGIGIGVPWEARRPLAKHFENGRYYTHVVALWYWLKLGLTGLVAYLLLVAATVHAGVRLWRSAPDRRQRAVGLAAAATMLALAVAETTGSFTGVDVRTTILVAASVGALAALQHRPAPAPRAALPKRAAR